MPEVSLIVTIKNRVQHFIQTFPSMVTQYGIPYELTLVDFHSEDGFGPVLIAEARMRQMMFSPFLERIKCLHVGKSLKFNSGKAKNLGAAFATMGTELLAFSDVDTFLSMDYLHHSLSKLDPPHLSFYCTRLAGTKFFRSQRLLPEINYGNMVIPCEAYHLLGGHDESNQTWGGDEDELIHRMKLAGLIEINPKTPIDARQYSILHDDELRKQELEDDSTTPPEEKIKWTESAETPFNRNFGFVEEIIDDVNEVVVYAKS